VSLAVGRLTSDDPMVREDSPKRDGTNGQGE
jgi:hypothetical protein